MARRRVNAIARLFTKLFQKRRNTARGFASPLEQQRFLQGRQRFEEDIRNRPSGPQAF